jgi:hypothetical protein
VLSPLPCWAELSPDAYRERVVAIVREITDEGRRTRDGRPVLGRKAILKQHPHDEPIHHGRSPAPLVHAATKAIRMMMRAAYWQFVSAYREAALQLRPAIGSSASRKALSRRRCPASCTAADGHAAGSDHNTSRLAAYRLGEVCPVTAELAARGCFSPISIAC